MFSRLMIAVAATVLAIVTSCLSSSITGQSAIAQVPGVYPFKLGDFTVLSDGTLPRIYHTLLSNTNQQKPIACFRKTF